MADQEIQDAVIRHAQADMADIKSTQGPIRPAELSGMERFNEWIQGNRDNLPSLGAELGAMFREGIKDIRQTFNEVMMGQHEHAPEMGAPMNPTPQIVTQDLQNDSRALFADYASRGVEREQQQEMVR